MKRTFALMLIATICAGLGWAAYRIADRALDSSTPDLSHLVPAGALLYLQAEDFSALLADWDKSPEKQEWVKSNNYEVFSRSRLFLRLKDALGEFSHAAGLPANTELVRQIAGKESAVALFDIGKLQFLYITRLPSGSAMQSALWQTRSKFETRSAGGVAFYLRRDPESNREVAFAVTGEYLLLATREGLMAGALQMLAGSAEHGMEAEGWWSRSIAAAGTAGDLRIVLNLEKIVPSPYFRSYWIQQNITEMAQYSAAISDLTRDGKEYREERVLLRKGAVTQSDAGASGPAGVADLARLVPANAGVYVAKSNPKPEDCVKLLETKILAPHLGPAAPEKLAPQVQLGNGEAGVGSDLETRIDQAPVRETVSVAGGTLLTELFAKNPVAATLQAQATVDEAQDPFVRMHAVVVFLGTSDWDEQAVKRVLVDFVRLGLTTGELGVVWRNNSGVSELDGLWPLAVSFRGKHLFVADAREILVATLANMDRKAAEASSVLTAGFNHGSERGPFLKLTHMLNLEKSTGGTGQAPDFFSGNIGGLSQALRGVASEKIVVRDAADKQTQTVTYAWVP
jgi:hypothetical protein